MKVRYLKGLDMAIVEFIENETIAATQTVTYNISHHYNAEAKLIGLCIHNASYNLPKEVLDAATIE